MGDHRAMSHRDGFYGVPDGNSRGMSHFREVPYEHNPSMSNEDGSYEVQRDYTPAMSYRDSNYEVPSAYRTLSDFSIKIASSDEEENEFYTGYEPLDPTDVLFEDKSIFAPRTSDMHKVDPSLLGDNSKRSTTLKLLIALFAITFLVLLVWQILVAKCLVSTLCETIDESSELSSEYLFKTMVFRVPSALIWIGLSVGSFGLLIAATWAFYLIRRSVGTARMAEMATIMRKGANSFLTQQYVVLFVPVVAMAILFGFVINWKTAGCFVTGALLCIVATHTGVSTASRGQARVPIVADDGVRDEFIVASRVGAIINLSIFAIAVIGTSAVYLMFSDIQALAGLATGASGVAFFIRISSGILALATNKNAVYVAKTRSDPVGRSGESECRSATWMMANIARGVGNIAGTSSDFFSTIVCAVLATAILGSGLPYFYRDSFALCVFNHLDIDLECGPFGYPETLSYAIYICTNDKLYLSYPALTTWASNSTFVALPFIIAAVGLLVCMLCTLHAQFSTRARNDEFEGDKVVHSIRRSMRCNIAFGYVVFILSCACVVFGLLGGNSEFQKSFVRKEELLRMRLDGSAGQCESKFLSENSIANPLPLPQGGVLKAEGYRPMTSSGTALGATKTAAWRVFGCILIGATLTLVTTGICNDFFTCSKMAVTQGVMERLQKSGGSSGLLQTTAMSLLSSVVGVALTAVCVLICHSVFGAYGIGMMGVSFVSSVGCRVSICLMGHIGDSANEIEHLTFRRREQLRFSETLSLLSTKVTPIGNSFLSLSSFVTCIILLFAGFQSNGLRVSPQSLIGSAESPPRQIISKAMKSGVSPSVMSVSLLMGIIPSFVIPWIVLYLSSRVYNVLPLKEYPPLPVMSRFSLFSHVISLPFLFLTSVAPQLAILLLPPSSFPPFLLSLITSSQIICLFLVSYGTTFNSALRTLFQSSGNTHKTIVRKKGSQRLPSVLVCSFRDVAGPCVYLFCKVSSCICLVSGGFRSEGKSGGWGNTKGWIGCAVLVGVVGVGVGIGWVMEQGVIRRFGKRADGDGEESRGETERKECPFYEKEMAVGMQGLPVGSLVQGRVEGVLGNEGRIGERMMGEIGYGKEGESEEIV